MNEETKKVLIFGGIALLVVLLWRRLSSSGTLIPGATTQDAAARQAAFGNLSSLAASEDANATRVQLAQIGAASAARSSELQYSAASARAQAELEGVRSVQSGLTTRALFQGLTSVASTYLNAFSPGVDGTTSDGLFSRGGITANGELYGPPAPSSGNYFQQVFGPGEATAYPAVPLNGFVGDEGAGQAAVIEWA